MVNDMGKKDVERILRSKVLSGEEIARDREIRRKIQGEFPPKPRRAVPDSLSEGLKRSIQASDLTVYEIAKRAGVSQIVISRFLSGERDIRMATADKLAEVLDLKLGTS